MFLARDGLADGHPQHGAVKVDLAEASAVGFETLETVKGLEVHDAVSDGEPVQAYLAWDAAVLGADGRLGRTRAFCLYSVFSESAT